MDRPDCISFIQDAIEFTFNTGLYWLSSDDKRDIQDTFDLMRDSLQKEESRPNISEIIDTLKVARPAIESVYLDSFCKRYNGCIRDLESIQKE